jgi:hypothetical protein
VPKINRKMKKTIFLMGILFFWVMISYAQYNDIINYGYKNGSLPDSIVQGIYAPDSNELWVITNAGLSHLKNNLWTHYNSTNSELLCSYMIRDVVADKTGTIWVATECGLYKFDNGHFIMYSTINSSIPCNQLQRIGVDENNTLWIATKKCGLIKYDGSVFTNFYKLNSGILSDTISDVYIKDSLKYLVYNDGLMQFDDKNWVNINFYDYIFEDHSIWRVVVDNQNNIYFSGWNSRIYVFDGINMISYIGPKPGDPEIRYFSNLLIDKDTVYLGLGFKGLAKMTNNQIFFFDSLINLIPALKKNSCLAKDKYGNLYVGTYINGVYKLSHKTLNTSINQEKRDSKFSSFSLNPNPTNYFVNIYKNGNTKILTISILDVQGKEKKSITKTDISNSNKIDISDFEKGIYFVRILTEANILYNYKLIKL